MASPWDILGLDSAHRDERAIKRAYAKLLKQHRPDQDPEGFTRIHEAYQWALRMAEDDDAARRPLTVSAPVRVVPVPVVRVQSPPVSPIPTRNDELSSASDSSSATRTTDGVRPEDAPTGDAAEVPTASSASSDLSAMPPEPPAPALVPAEVVPAEPFVPPAAEVAKTTGKPITEQAPPAVVLPPPAWEVALDDLEHLAGQPDSPLRREAVIAVLRRLAGLVTQRLGDAAVLATLLNRFLPDGRTQWRLVFDDDDLLAEMRRGRSDLTAHTLRGCFECGDWIRLRQFARRWLEEDVDTLQSSDAVALTRVLAVWLAPFDYALADQLVGRLPLAMRRNADNELDTLLAVGREASTLPEDSRLYLCHLLVGRTPPANEKLCWRTGGLLSQLPHEGILFRLLRSDALDHFGGYVIAISGSGGVTMFSAIVWISSFVLSVSLWALSHYLMLIFFGRDLAGGLGILLMLFGIPVAMYFLVRWMTRRWSQPYHSRLRPWLWRFLGPFDWPLLLLVFYGWLSIGSLWLGIDSVVFARGAANTEKALVWLLFAPPGIILVVHWGRYLMRSHPDQFPPWQSIPGRIARIGRLFSSSLSSSQQEVNRDEGKKFLAAFLAACPAMLGGVTIVAGLALCPAYRLNDGTGGIVTALVWSGPALLIMSALHAWWISWQERDRQPWWWPFVLFGGCVLIPGFTWFVAMGPLWFGGQNEPSANWLTHIATAVVSIVIYGFWLRVGQRLPVL